MLIERLRKRGVSLTRLPRAAQLDEYEEASQEIEDLLRGLPGIVAIYRTGTVSVPGISDLDRIAVVEEGAPAPPAWSVLSERTRYLAMHAPFLVDLAGFRRHRWFAYMEPLHLSFGTAVELEDPPLPQESEPLIGAESMVVALLTTVKQLSTGLLKVRPSLCQLNNVRHALALAQMSRDEAPAAWRVAGDVERLRNTWFTSPDPERRDLVKDVAARTVPALLEVLWALGERSEPATTIADGMKLGAPWSNVTLHATETGRNPVTGTARFRLPLIRSAKAAELLWRVAQPRIALHPAVLALLAGVGGQERESFRSTRDELVRNHGEFLAVHGLGYSGIGLASPFLPPPASESRRSRLR